MRLAIIGSRTFNDYSLLEREVRLFELSQGERISMIISGGAKGADTLAHKFAANNNIPIMEIIPNWNKFGKKAGMLRNIDIWNDSDCGIAFWDGESKGTKHSFSIAKQQNKILKIITYKD